MLNQDQENALKQLIVFLARPSQKDFIIDAPAGCGKGYLLHHIYNNQRDISERVRIIDDNFTNQFRFTATTNEAVSGLPREASTIYSFAGLRPNRNNGFFKSKTPTRDRLVVFVDEASYVGKDAYTSIRMQLPNAKIVWVMDEFQLTDVKEKKAYVSTLGFPKVEMAKVERNQGAIQQASLELRDAVKHERYIDIRKFANGNDIILLPPDSFDGELINHFKQGSNVAYLGYTNAQVGMYNSAIHQRVFNNPPFPHSGAVGIINKYNDNVNLRCGTTVHIHSVAIEEVVLEHGSKITETYLNTDQGTLIMCNDYVPMSEYNPNRWEYSDVVLPYGRTVHKSQDQSIDTVFIDMPNIESCRDPEMVRRLKYVGTSRGISKVYIKDYHGS